MRNINPFWALVDIVKDDNNTEKLKIVVAKADRETTTERVQYNSKDVNIEDDDDRNDKDSDEEDQE